MTENSPDYELIIIGASFSGASLAWLVKSRNPKARVLLIERAETFDRKVGESTSEVAGCFLTRILHLGDHLSRRHIAKHGLHLWFTTPENQDPAQCSEIGPDFQSRLPAYQLHRPILDQHILDRALSLGCQLIRPATVRSIKLEDPAAESNPSNTPPHQVTVKDPTHGTRTLTTRWLIDASGRAAVIARQQGTLEKLDSHPINSMWVRYQGVRNFDSWEHRADKTGLPSNGHSPRYNATNHFCGFGWWCWLIPLENGELSAGLSWDPRLFTPEKQATIAQTLHHHLLQHPVGKALFKNAQPVENDCRTYSHLPYHSTQVSGHRWAAIGDAAGFMDPLYSQGLDYCAHTTFSAMRLILEDLDELPPTLTSAQYNQNFQESYQRWYLAIYHNKYSYLGDAELMNIAYLLDIGLYFIGPVRFVYDNPETEFASMPYVGGPGAQVAKFMAFYNRRLNNIALRRHAAGTYGQQNLNHQLLVKAGFGPNKLATTQILRALRKWLWLEVKSLKLDPLASPEPDHTTLAKSTTPHP